MWRPPARRLSAALLAFLATLLATAGCREREPEAAESSRGAGPAATDGALRTPAEAASVAGLDDDVAALAPLLDRAATSSVGPADRAALEDAMRRVLAPLETACEGCRASVSYRPERGGGGHFRAEVRTAAGDAVLDVELFHRPDLPIETVESWARIELAGHPASVAPRERLFVWPGRVEVRVFARDGLGAGAGLEELVASLPLDALARL